MKKYALNFKSTSFLAIVALLLISLSSCSENKASQNVETALQTSEPIQERKTKKLIYIVSDLNIPFWAIMSRGFSNAANSLGYDYEIYDAQNSAKKELLFTSKAMRDEVSGIIVSPTSSSACATILKLAKSANVPVVVSDVGTDGGDYVSFISSDNEAGAYALGKLLGKKMKSLGWSDKRVGIVAIPQKRLNGQLRTAGFTKAMSEEGIKGAGILQQVNFSMEETYRLSKKLIKDNPDLGAIWLQGSDKYEGALRAIEDSGKRGEILLTTFDAEPEFLDLIQNETLVASAMQQPYLMGEESVRAMDRHLKGSNVTKNLQLSVIAVSKEDMARNLPLIQRNVFGIEK